MTTQILVGSPITHLFHVFSYRVLLKELCAFPCVEAFCIGQELALKVLFVYR